MKKDLDVLLINSIESLGIIVLKNCLIANGLNAECYVSTDPEQLKKEIIKKSPKILAISWNFDYIIYEILMSLSEIKKHLPLLKVTVGGYGATNDLVHIKEYSEIDVVTVGESDETISPVCKYLLSDYFIKNIKPLVVSPQKLPNLSNYDYNNNMIVKNDVIYTMTARNCIKGENRCWYCTCSTAGCRFLDLEKVISSIKLVITNKTKEIVLADAEVLSGTVNRLWKEFQKPLNCFMLARDLHNLDESVKGCHFIVGVDYYIPGKNGNFIDAKMIKDIKKCSEKNKISISTVYSEDHDTPEREKAFLILRKISENNPNIDITFPKLVMYPGTDGVELKENIYLKKINFNDIFTDIGSLGEFNTNGQDQISFTTWEEAFDIK